MSPDRRGRVGYGKPPTDRQFKPGKSGNPKGRPKRSRNIATEILAELETMIAVREGGREVQISKGAALAKSLVARALKGEMRAVAVLLSILPDKFTVLPDAVRESALEDQEVAILERLIARRLAADPQGSPPASPTPSKHAEDLDQKGVGDE